MSSSQEEARYLYEANGDTSSSLATLHQYLENNNKNNPSDDEITVIDPRDDAGNHMKHNVTMLTYLSSLLNVGSGNAKEFKNNLQDLHDKVDKEYTEAETNGGSDSSSRIIDSDDSICKLVLAHNLALAYLIGNNPEKALKTLLPQFKKSYERYISMQKKTNSKAHGKDEDRCELEDVECKISFLVLDCMLALGTMIIDTNITAENIISWIENYIFQRSIKEEQKQSTSLSAHPHKNNSTCHIMESTIELKFRLHCYKSRIFFSSQKQYGHKMKQQLLQRDAKTRLARKELKSAMEIYHHKLRGKKDKSDETGSSSYVKQGGGTASSRAGSTDGGASVQGSVGSLSNDVSQQHYGGSEPNNASSVHMPSSNIDNVSSHGGDEVPLTTYQQNKKLHSQSQFALYLKANLEFIKGNTKKSLKLCSEAQNAGIRQREKILGSYSNDDPHETMQDDSKLVDLQRLKLEGQRSTDIDSALYYNNLAIVHQISGKINIAMHYYSRALSHVERLEQTQQAEVNVEKDGTASPIPTCQILYNASLCSQHAKQFLTAYECMARCVNASPGFFATKPRCWLRLAENCIGIHTNLKKETSDKNILNVTKQRHLKHPSLMINSNTEIYPAIVNSNFVAKIMGCKEDVEKISENPLPRALYCLNHCISICCQNEDGNSNSVDLDHDCLESARVSLAYVCLELNNPSPVVQLAEVVLRAQPLLSTADGSDEEEYVLSRRRRATVRMYACEALCILGKPKEGQKYLIGGTSGKHMSSIEADQLGKELMMGTSNEGVGESISKLSETRELHGKALVHISASGVAASMGEIEVAKKHAILANSLESSESNDQVKKTLIYCSLSDGKIEDALKILRSSR